MTSRALHAPVRNLEKTQQHLDVLIDRLTRSGDRILERAHAELDRLRDRLQAADPEQPLRRGYALVTRDDTPIRSAAALEADDLVTLHFNDDTREAEVLPNAPRSDGDS